MLYLYYNLYYYIWFTQKPYEAIIIIILWNTEKSNNTSKVKYSQEKVELRLEPEQLALESTCSTRLFI